MATIEQNIDLVPENISDSFITLEEFLRLYSDIEDGYKYEYNAGIIEKTKSMDQEQGFIQKILMRLFIKTTVFQEDGSFLAETDMKTSETQLRRPDLSIYYGSQQAGIAKRENQVAPWVAEIISPSDNANKINLKTDEYFKAGVKVVWNIYPASNQVYVYTSPEDIKVCRGKTICSAKPALPDFEISAENIFAYKTQYLQKD